MSATILIVGSLVGASCALVGTFLVLRRLALLGDAISHAVLPGIAIAFLLTGKRSPLPMVIGAGALGVLTVFLIETLSRTRRLKEDAAIGAVFPALFSLGVILISRYASNVDLDVECVLYGDIALAPFDSLVAGGANLGPKALWVTGGILLLDLGLILSLYKELKLTSFDPDLAAALGVSPVLVHYLLMSAVSVTVVGSFESVGAILVVAMLIVPPATAYLLCRRLSVMLLLAVAFGVASAAGGYWLAHEIDCSIAGAMATMAGVFFLLALVFAPEGGLLSSALRQRRLRLTLAGDLLLLHLRSGAEGVSRAAMARRFAWRPRELETVLGRLLERRLVELEGDNVRLTHKGARRLERRGTSVLAHTNGDD